MAKNSCTSIKKRVIVSHHAAAIAGRVIFGMPPRWDPPAGPIFNALELAPVAVYEDGECEPYESLADIPKAEVQQVLWSIYGHTPGEGVQCIGDFTSRDHALEVIRRLLGDLRPFEPRESKRPRQT